MDLSGPAPVLKELSFFLEGEKLPEEFEALPLLCALWETGRVRPERVSVQAHFHS